MKNLILGTLICLLIAGCTQEATYPIAVESGRTLQHLEVQDEQVRLCVYNPDFNNCPAVIVLHGEGGLKSEELIQRYENFAQDLMREGMFAVIVYYFDNRRAGWIEVIRQAISYCARIQCVDAQRIGLVGFSLGGTLGLEAAASDDRIKVLAVHAGNLPEGFIEEQAQFLPVTFFISGSEDTAMKALTTLEGWFEGLGKPFYSRINYGYDDKIPEHIFQEDWQKIVQFFKDYL